MKTYEAVFKKGKDKGVYGISLVKNPAMEGKFLKLAKHEESIKLQSVDNEKRILLGLVLEPNKLIYRNQGGEEFNITFSEDTVKELAHNFQREGYQNNSSIEHSDIVRDVTFVESWTVENPELDKSVNFGLSYPKGSWLVMMKVDSDKVWDDYIKTGDVQGFSVDALVELKEIKTTQMSKETELTVEDEKFFSKIKELFLSVFPKKEEEIKLGEVKSDDGTVTYYYDGDVIEPTKTVIWTQTEDSTRVDLPAGDYKTEDGKTIVLGEGGVVSEIKDAMPTEEEVPAALEEAPVAAPSAPVGNPQEEAINTIKSLLVKFKEDNKNKDVNLSESEVVIELKKEIKELKDEVLELSKRPAAKKRNSQPVQKSYEEMTGYEKRQYDKENE